MAMEEKEEKKRHSTLKMVLGGAAIAAASCVVIPPLMKKSASKLYKAQSDTSDIDFDEMGPEIVPIDRNDGSSEQPSDIEE